MLTSDNLSEFYIVMIISKPPKYSNIELLDYPLYIQSSELAYVRHIIGLSNSCIRAMNGTIGSIIFDSIENIINTPELTQIIKIY